MFTLPFHSWPEHPRRRTLERLFVNSGPSFTLLPRNTYQIVLLRLFSINSMHLAIDTPKKGKTYLMGAIARIFGAPLTSHDEHRTIWFLSHISNNYIIRNSHKKIEKMC